MFLATTRRKLATGIFFSLAFGLLVGVITLRVGTTGHGAGLFEAYDFRALYCGGAATLEHRNPYRVEPLRACEHDRSPTKLFVADVPTWVVLPAPYPGYALGLFSGLARFSFPVAKAIWLGILATALAFLAIALADLSGFPIVIAAIALVPTVVLYNLWLGSTPPLAMLGLALAAVAVARDRPAWAAPPLAVAMIDPHLALPAAIALVVIAPRARLAAVISVAVLIGFSLYAIGFSGNVEYFREVLPMHARAEVFVRLQYSLTHLLAIVGVPVDVALKAGTISYGILAFMAVCFASREPDTALGRTRAIVLPTAVVALGGAFIHAQEISLALPAAFVLVRCVKTDLQRALLTVAFMGLLFSPIFTNTRLVAPSYVLASAVLGGVLWPQRRFRAALTTASLAIALIVGIRYLPQAHFHDLAAASIPEPAGISNATSSGVVWAKFLARRPSWTEEDPFSIAFKIPTWIGLMSLIALGFSTRTRSAEGSTSAFKSGIIRAHSPPSTSA